MMSIYQLESNETVLYKGTMLDFSEKEKHNPIGSTISYELILTNLNVVFVKKVKKYCQKKNHPIL